MPWAKLHQEAQMDLERIKKKFKKIPLYSAYMKRVSENGAISVLRVDYTTLEAEVVKKKEVEELGLNPASLYDYYSFKKEKDIAFKYLRGLVLDGKDKFKSMVDPIKERDLNEAYSKRRRIYDAYLASEEWQSKREKCFSVHGYTCKECGIKRATDVHHLHYNSLGDENVEKDLEPLCTECHKQKHM